MITATHWVLLSTVERMALQKLPCKSHTTIKQHVYDDLDEISVIVNGSTKDWHILVDLMDSELILVDSGRRISLADPQLAEIIGQSLEIYGQILLYGKPRPKTI